MLHFCRPSKAGNMAAMQNRAPVSRWAIPALVALCAIALGGPADAKNRKKKTGKPYIFKLTKIELKKGVPGHVEAQVRKQVDDAIEKHEQLVAKLGDGAPDAETSPKKFERYIKRRRQRAFKVNVEVTDYSHEVEEDEGIRRLRVSVTIRMFGETYPKRVMAFSGDGAATIKIDIGKELRKRDTDYANEEAIKLAVADAIAISIKKLKAPKKKKRRKRRKKK